ncbi:MAG: hypothetical protein Q8N12_08220 [Thermodesulfovibrionales bacterium]|nr:hypothetical protein [Thermodesulfovibrionales bacterium]
MVGQEAKFGIESELRVTATNVTQALMEEIKTKKWDQNSPIPPGTASTTLGPESATYDDIDDFNNLPPWNDTTCTDTVNVNNVVFTREVDVCYVNPTTLGDCLGTKTNCTRSGATPTDYKKITVTVRAPATNWDSSVELMTVMTNY